MSLSVGVNGVRGHKSPLPARSSGIQPHPSFSSRSKRYNMSNIDAEAMVRQCNAAYRLDPGLGSRLLASHFNPVYQEYHQQSLRQKSFESRMNPQTFDADSVAEAERMNQAMEDFMKNDPFSHARDFAMSSEFNPDDMMSYYSTFDLPRNTSSFDSTKKQEDPSVNMYLEGLSSPLPSYPNSELFESKSSNENSGVISNATTKAQSQLQQPQPQPQPQQLSASNSSGLKPSLSDSTTKKIVPQHDFRHTLETEDEINNTVAMYTKLLDEAKQSLASSKKSTQSEPVSTSAAVPPVEHHSSQVRTVSTTATTTPKAHVSASPPVASAAFQESFGMSHVPLSSTRETITGNAPSRQRAISSSLFDFRSDDSDEYLVSNISKKQSSSLLGTSFSSQSSKKDISSSSSSPSPSPSPSLSSVQRTLSYLLDPNITKSPDLLLINDDVSFSSLSFERQMYLCGKRLLVESWDYVISTFRMVKQMIDRGIFDSSWDDGAKRFGQMIYWLRFADPGSLPLLLSSTAMNYFSKPLHLGTLIEDFVIPEY